MDECELNKSSAVRREFGPGGWPHERPPRLHEDFDGEIGRNGYEVARAQWFTRHSDGSFPPFDLRGTPDKRRQQITARAPLWDKAVRTWKDRHRDRSDRVRPVDDNAQRLVRDRRAKQRAWADLVGQIAVDKYAAPEPDALSWPACEWRRDREKLTALSLFLASHPPTGDKAWCHAVEDYAAELFLAEGQYWDDVLAPGYRMLTSLPGTPRPESSPRAAAQRSPVGPVCERANRLC